MGWGSVQGEDPIQLGFRCLVPEGFGDSQGFQDAKWGSGEDGYHLQPGATIT